MMTRQGFVSVVMHVVLLITFIGLISMVFNLHRFAFFGEFIILLALILMGIAAVIGLNNNFSWTWKLLSAFFAIVFINMLLIYLLSTAKPELFSQYLFVVIAGFFISVFSLDKPTEKGEVKKTFKPGKFIASKSGSKFHAPKCDWAKRVKKSNAVWFNTKAEAKKAGYKADDCVK